MATLLVTVPGGREGDAALELEWALGAARVRRTKWRGVLIARTPLSKEEALERIREFDTTAIFKVIPIDKFVESKKEKILEEAFRLAKEYIKEGDSFAVRCKRRGSWISSGKEIEIELGAKIKEELKAKVDLTTPDWYIWVEVLGKETGISVIKPEEIVKKRVEF
ncbi:RNA-binding protein [Thermococcus sp. 101 C5]|jgi:tRNA acetyltransferase TAN1|uniref:THUMP domain-containing protein n=1 Tax=Thermococcus TaxID=2263 RepID=UPI0005B2B0E7|nr:MULTISPECIES: THUMP domain-containing protein [Thermococcus]MCA6214851.1 RNA-binding protein [Thermococcus bergensis]MDK2853468.1 tRNA acetyltransferase [Thermococcaceae archaeon]MDK2982884.1 tRNA acetyltransferase [Thermococcaceae archaeon]MPW39721.1 RNA-binding protein [Thermococcus sp. 101 C5]